MFVLLLDYFRDWMTIWIKHRSLVSKENKMTLLTGPSENHNHQIKKKNISVAYMSVVNLVQSKVYTIASLETENIGCCRQVC